MTVAKSSGKKWAGIQARGMVILDNVKVEIQGSDLADLLRHLDIQDHNISVLMQHWEDLVRWVYDCPRKYLPRNDLLEKLREISPL